MLNAAKKKVKFAFSKDAFEILLRELEQERAIVRLLGAHVHDCRYYDDHDQLAERDSLLRIRRDQFVPATALTVTMFWCSDFYNDPRVTLTFTGASGREQDEEWYSMQLEASAWEATKEYLPIDVYALMAIPPEVYFFLETCDLRSWGTLSNIRYAFHRGKEALYLDKTDYGNGNHGYGLTVLTSDSQDAQKFWEAYMASHGVVWEPRLHGKAETLRRHLKPVG